MAKNKLSLYERLTGRLNSINKSKMIQEPEISAPILEIVSDEGLYNKLISQLRTSDNSKEFRYLEYDAMEADSRIKAALVLYADGATQTNAVTGKVFDIESKDEDLRSDIESFLDKLEIENIAWELAYNLAKYGNTYIQVYHENDHKDIDHVEVKGIGSILDLYLEGKPVFFAQVEDDTSLMHNSDYELYDRNSFIHFYIRGGTYSDDIRIQTQSKDGSQSTVTYSTVEGASIIDSLRSTYRILRTLEDTMITARTAKSEFIRIFNIEVGNSSNQDARLAVNKVKKLFDSTVSMNVRNGQYSATKTPRPFADPIFNSVSNGKGALTIESFGGDYDPKTLTDIEYFENMLFAGLGIPKAYLGYEGDVGVFSAEQSLAQRDIRYGRRISKIYDAIILGLTELVDDWLILHKREKSIGKYKIVHVPPSTEEENARLTNLQTKVGIVNDIFNTVTGAMEGVNKVKLFYALSKQLLNAPELMENLKPIFEESLADAEILAKTTRLTNQQALKDLEDSEIDSASIDNDSSSDFGSTDYMEDEEISTDEDGFSTDFPDEDTE